MLFTALYRIYFIGIANCYVNVIENVTANEIKQNRTVYDREWISYDTSLIGTADSLAAESMISTYYMQCTRGPKPQYSIAVISFY